MCFKLPGRYGGRVGSGGEPTPRYMQIAQNKKSGLALPLFRVDKRKVVFELTGNKRQLSFK